MKTTNQTEEKRFTSPAHINAWTNKPITSEEEAAILQVFNPNRYPAKQPFPSLLQSAEDQRRQELNGGGQ